VTQSSAETAISPSVDPAEIAKFNAMAAEWWDPNGKFRPLHLISPVRLGFLREYCSAHFGRDSAVIGSFKGLTLVDVGCGGGLLSEPMAKQGFDVLGIDASEKNVSIAQAHTKGRIPGLEYRAVGVEALAAEGGQFDVVLNMEVVEHVHDLPGFIASCAALVKPGGLMFVATLNRTLKSLALAKIGAEYVLRWLPPGTHDWDRFVRPDELAECIEAAGLKIEATQGVSFDPLRWEWRLSGDTDVNYMVVAGR